MKKTVLGCTLITLVNCPLFADTTIQQPSTAPIPAAPTAAPAPQPVIDCNYKISPQTKTIDQSVILSWAKNAVIQSFSFKPAIIDEQMQKLQPCFTEQGWSGFNAALQKSGNVQAIKSQNLDVTSQIDGQILINDMKNNQWKLILPLAVVYQNEKEKVSQLLSVDLTVGRKPNGDLGIVQMIAAPRGTVTTIKPGPDATPTPAQRSLDVRPDANGNPQPVTTNPQ